MLQLNTMDPLMLTAAKNRRTGFLLRIRRKVATLKTQRSRDRTDCPGQLLDWQKRGRNMRAANKEHPRDAAARGETTTDDDLEEEVEETYYIECRKTPKLTASKDDTSDNDLLTELSESPMHVATP